MWAKTFSSVLWYPPIVNWSFRSWQVSSISFDLSQLVLIFVQKIARRKVVTSVAQCFLEKNLQKSRNFPDADLLGSCILQIFGGAINWTHQLFLPAGFMFPETSEHFFIFFVHNTFCFQTTLMFFSFPKDFFFYIYESKQLVSTF